MYEKATNVWRAFALAVAVGAVIASPHIAQAQTQLPSGICDFDIADDLGQFVSGGSMHLEGRPGSSSTRGTFFLINADSAEYDVDKDGYNAPGTACDFTSLYFPADLRGNLINVSNPALQIASSNIIVVNMPRRLPNGTMARVDAYIDIPRGTVAGRYVGTIWVRDSIYGVRATGLNEVLATDRMTFDLTVDEDRQFSIISADSAAVLDSLVIRGRAGSRATGALRIGNGGNTNLSDVRITATDLRSESAVGLIIPASNITFSAATLSSIQVGDTARLTVTVQIPRNILGGRYRGTIMVQAANTPPQQIPLIVIVTSTRGILFGNNPVREINGDLANIAFNGDPGTQWKLSIYDMAGLVTYKATGNVFAGAPLPGAPGTLVGADYAVNVIWPLRNGRGEGVASGMYLVVVESMVNGKRQLAQDKLMVIR